MDKIFVLVPVYNVEKYLERCIDSILNQTYTNWELVLVNDGSKDNSGAICDRYAAEHENITVIHQENGGVSVARNTAVEYALKHGNHENDWIAFVDSDDFVYTQYLEYLYRAAKETQADISCCAHVRTSMSNIAPIQAHTPTYKLISPELYWQQSYTDANVPWGKLYKLFLFMTVRYPVGRIYEDNFTTYKILFQYSTIVFIENKLYYWYITPESITTSVWSPKRIDQIDAAETQYADLKKGGYSRACKRSARYLFWGCIKSLIHVHRLSPQYDHLIPEIEARRRKALHIYAKEVGWIPALCYWLTVQHLAPAGRKLKRKLKKLLYSR